MNNIIKRKWNQNSMVIIEDLQGMAFQAESGGHTFQISGIDGDGNPVALSGTPAGVMLRADGQDVTLTCSVSGGVVSATLPANAYSVPGRFGLTIFLTSDGQKTAIYAAVGTVGKTSSGTVAPPAGSDVVTLVNAIATAVATIPASYTDLMAAVAPTYSSSGLYAVGSYAWYNGKLYRCTTAITSGETWTSGHWTLANLGSDLVDLKSAIINTNEYVSNPQIAKKTVTTGAAWGYVDVFTLIDLLSGETYLFTFEKADASVGGYAELYNNAGNTKFYTVTLNNKTKATYEYTPESDMNVKVKVGFGTANITCKCTVGYKTGRLETIEANVSQNTTDISENATRINTNDKKFAKCVREQFVRRNSSNTGTGNASSRVDVNIAYVTTGLYLFHITRASAITDAIGIYRVYQNVATDTMAIMEPNETEIYILWNSDAGFDKIGIQGATSNSGIVYTVEAFSMLDGEPLSTGDEIANNTVDIVPNATTVAGSVGDYRQIVYLITRLTNRNLIPVKDLLELKMPTGYQLLAYYYDGEKKYLSASSAWQATLMEDDVTQAGASYVAITIRNTSTPSSDISSQAKTVQNGITIKRYVPDSGGIFSNRYNLQFAWGYVTSSGGISPTGNDWYLVAICAVNGAKKIYTNNFYNSSSMATIAFYGESNSDVLATYVQPEQNVFDVPFGARFFAITSNIVSYQDVVAEGDYFANDDKNEIIPNELNYIGGRILEIYNPYHDQYQNQYMGQLHSHSYGNQNPEDDTPERLEDYYDALVEKGYDFGTVTNYYRVSHNPKPSGSLVWLFDGCEQGYSNEQEESQEPGHHIVMWNTPTSQSGTGTYAAYPSPFISVQDVLRIYKNTAMLDLAHPMWVSTLLNDTKAKKIKGLHYTEVFSGTIGQLYGKGTAWTGNADDAWNRLLSAGNYCFAIGNADGHNAEDWYLGLGNVKVFASAKTWQAIYDSFIKGNFYAASNVLVSISGVSYSNGVYSVDTGDATATTYFYGKGRELLKTQTGQNVSYTLEGDEGFVYAKVVFPADDEDVNVAFTQPVFICGVRN